MRRIGFSTGAVARGDFRRALSLLSELDVTAVELSALRIRELDPLIGSLDELDLSKFRYVAVHAPADFTSSEEESVIQRLKVCSDRGWLIVLHPDSMWEYRRWLLLQQAICFENMDKRKPIGRTTQELEVIFQRFPNASLCFDIGHAHQVDRTMCEARLIVQKFSSRIRHIHVSEVNTLSQHVAVTAAAKYAFRKVLDVLPEDAPLIVESVVQEADLQSELDCITAIFKQHVKHLLETD